MNLKGKAAVGVIIEAPFYNIVEELELHPFTMVCILTKAKIRENIVDEIFKSP
jgi:hypothetical protein